MSDVYDASRLWEFPAVPENEDMRERVLEEYSFDTHRDDNLSTFVQSLANSLATITRCKVVCLTIVKGDKQIFYGNHGLKVNTTPRSQSFCAHAINKPKEPLIVLNALEDNRFAENPLVLGDPNIRFYHGVPLVNTDGAALGALCSINDQPSRLQPDQEAALNLMAKMCVAQLELVRIFRMARFDDDENRAKRAKTIKHIRNVLGKNIAFLPSSNARLRAHIENSGNVYDEFEKLLRDENGSMMMFFQLGKEQNLEQLMFWQLAEVYRERPCVEYLVGAVDAFLITNSEYEVNLNGVYKKQILDVYERVVDLLKQDVQTPDMQAEANALCTPDLLDKLQLDMFDLLHDNTYSRLVDSPAYEEYLRPRLNRSASFLRSISMLSPWGKKKDKAAKSSSSSGQFQALPEMKSEGFVSTNSKSKEAAGNKERRNTMIDINSGRGSTESDFSKSDKTTRDTTTTMRRKSSDGNRSLASEFKAPEESESSTLDVQTEKEERSPSPLLSPLHSLRSLVKKCSTGVTTGITRDFS